MKEQEIRDIFALNCNICTDKNGVDVTEKVIKELHQKFEEERLSEEEVYKCLQEVHPHIVNQMLAKAIIALQGEGALKVVGKSYDTNGKIYDLKERE